MEQNLPMVAKRMWRIVRVAYFMLRKGLSSKRKLLLDLNMFMKRGKLAGKAAMTNLMTLHVSAVAGASSSFRRSSAVPSGEYEFSCSNTPVRRNHHSHANFFTCAHAPATMDEDVDVIRAAMELISGDGEASPALLDFRPVRQLRVTDSPFPLRDADEVDSRQVDEAAEAFIRRFYKDLSRQSLRSPLPN